MRQILWTKYRITSITAIPLLKIKRQEDLVVIIAKLRLAKEAVLEIRISIHPHKEVAFPISFSIRHIPDRYIQITKMQLCQVSLMTSALLAQMKTHILQVKIRQVEQVNTSTINMLDCARQHELKIFIQAMPLISIQLGLGTQSPDRRVASTSNPHLQQQILR